MDSVSPEEADRLAKLLAGDDDDDDELLEDQLQVSQDILGEDSVKEDNNKNKEESGALLTSSDDLLQLSDSLGTSLQVIPSNDDTQQENVVTSEPFQDLLVQEEIPPNPITIDESLPFEITQPNEELSAASNGQTSADPFLTATTRENLLQSQDTLLDTTDVPQRDDAPQKIDPFAGQPQSLIPSDATEQEEKMDNDSFARKEEDSIRSPQETANTQVPIEMSTQQVASLPNKDIRNPFVDDEDDEGRQVQEEESSVVNQETEREQSEEITAPYGEVGSLPLSLMVCAVGGGLRLKGGGHSWIVYLSASVLWSQIAELAATVMFGMGLVCRPLCDGKCSSSRHACGPQLPALVFLRPQDNSSRLRLVVASGATANKKRALVAGAVSIAPLELSPEDETLAIEAVAQLRKAVETQISKISGVDSVFALDLERAFAAELEANLRAYSEPLDTMARDEELRTAQAMALLTAAYSSAGVKIPRPQRAPPLSSFPLVGARPRLLGYFGSELQAETRSKEAIQHAIALGAHSPQEIVQIIIADLQAWCSAEAAARTKRKAAAVSARLRNAEEHGRSLIQTLANDRKKRSTGRVSMFTSSAAERRFCSLFRIADTDRDALLYDCTALRVPKAGEGVVAGRLYIAASACYWHAKTLLPTGHGDSQQVTPYYALDSVQLREGLLSSTSQVVSDGSKESSATDTASSTTKQFFGVAARRAASVVSIAASKAVEKVALNLADEKLARVALVDAARRDAAVFFLPPSPNVPDHAQRVVDLIRLAKKVYDDTRKTASTKEKSYDTEMGRHDASKDDEVAILERVQKIALISARNAKLLDEAKESSKLSTLDTATSVLSSSLSAAKAKSLDATNSFLKLSGFASSPEKPPPKDDAAIIADIISSAIQVDDNTQHDDLHDDEIDLDMPPSRSDSSDERSSIDLVTPTTSTYNVNNNDDLGPTFTPQDPSAAQRRLTMLQAFLDE
eukprot:CAMPEP_0197318356 /NCGR_PEP_ID=MMETSP0891-20130614/50731_1 /TAXON_ID=44058 ORGANISM="Aureoumbra lagunensis, Strain CCMP1510" /NCGR_SAMPLE_ID=MMETSP0891 /ASSEMBLY_ACC=CAM_ASM_000534 /LENGTH=968 /DNA_ID=CAMNT_0042808781 /DNA_START=60 /DNA_END=2963 /DNA_ORIENTATION=-